MNKQPNQIVNMNHTICMQYANVHAYEQNDSHTATAVATIWKSIVRLSGCAAGKLSIRVNLQAGAGHAATARRAKGAARAGTTRRHSKPNQAPPAHAITQVTT